MGANDDEHLGWIGPTKELIRDAADRGLPTLGICLGHQLVAAALGGRVDAQPARPAGRAARRRLDRGRGRRPAVRAAWPRRAAACSGTTTSSSSCPPSAVVLAADRPTARCRSPASARDAWGVQLHPEVDAAIVGTWVSDTERGSLADRGLDADALLARDRGGPGRARRGLARRSRRASPRGAGTSDRAHEPGPTTARARCSRLGFQRPGRRAGRRLRRLGDAAEPLVALLARTADPDQALGRSWSGWPRRRSTTEPVLLEALVDDEGTAMRLLSRARRQRGAGRPPVPAPRALARAHRPDARHDPPGGVRRPRGAAARGRRRPARPGADGRRSRTPRRSTRCGWSTAGVLLRLAARDLTHHLGRRRRRGRALRPRRRHPGGRAGRRPAAGRARRRDQARLAVIAMGKCGGHELNYVSDVDVIFVLRAGRRAPTTPTRRSRPPPSSPAT